MNVSDGSTDNKTVFQWENIRMQIIYFYAWNVSNKYVKQ
jgi:hypothetical protein